MKPKLFIGIDPGGNCGMATILSGIPTPNLFQFKSNIEAMFFVIELSIDHTIEVYIEDARKAVKNGYFARTGNTGKVQGVGYVKGYSAEWEAFCKLKRFPFVLLAPNPKLTKTTPEYFERLTGLRTLKTEHHKRDAAMLILGKK